ncbi:DMT family transporter [Microvirga pudoricolor]|uniref:DMT family transporter n=1 Tax=Microvirga pudoricolor TaxID=2778729 RepID=UPI001950D45D|nr:DMT family transporter [Microvirga pudoricolor]MBM6594615.1 DMT family transporter [Microvirga pudoricolor]
MPFLALAAALGASLCWALGAILAHDPARKLGAFAFTRVQLIGASSFLILLVTATGQWINLDWRFTPAIAISIVSVLVGNLAMIGCLRRGGPRRNQLLLALAAPMAAGLGYLFLGEAISAPKLLGGAVVLCGVGLAIFYGAGRTGLEPLDGPIGQVVGLGILAAAAQAVALIALKPVLLAGVEPLAASALRTGGGAVIMILLGFWPSAAFRPLSTPTPRLVMAAMVPGFLGYVLAVSLLLYALRGSATGLATVLGSISPVLMLPMIWYIRGRCPPLPAWIGAGLVALGTGVIVLG